MEIDTIHAVIRTRRYAFRLSFSSDNVWVVCAQRSDSGINRPKNARMRAGMIPTRYIQRHEAPAQPPTTSHSNEATKNPPEKEACKTPAPFVRKRSGQVSC